jgi:hypothetical protein
LAAFLDAGFLAGILAASGLAAGFLATTFLAATAFTLPSSGAACLAEMDPAAFDLLLMLKFPTGC